MRKRFVHKSAASLAALALSVALFAVLSPTAYADGGDPPDFLIVDDGSSGGEDIENAGNTSMDIPSSGITLISKEHVAYITGSENVFAPNENLTRAQTAQMLYRLLSKTVPITKTFTDVPDGIWYADAANTLGSLGVLRPGKTTFQPDDEVTRAEFVRCVAQFFPLREDAEQFADVPADSPDGPYLLSARAWGWLAGFEDGTVRPEQPVTRAEAVALLNRALGRSPDKDYIDRAHPVFYWDISPDNWYYYDVVEASTSHERTGNVVTEQWTSHSPADTGISTGFHHWDGWLYYFDSEKNDVVRSASVGNFDFDEKGRFTSGSSELDQLLHDIYIKQTRDSMTQEEKLRALYVYTRDSFTYLRRPSYEFGVLDFMQTDALDMLKTGYGNCYSYASVFWYLSRWNGYDSRIINGTVGQRKSPHSWVEITFDGKSYIFDTELEMAYIKRGEHINMYKWTGAGFNYIK